MITQRHNPAYRPARTKKETLRNERFFFCASGSLFIAFAAIFLFAVFTSVNFFLRVGKDKYLIQTLLDGSDAARVLAFDNICDLLWKLQDSFFNDLLVFDDIDSDVVIDETENVQVKVFDWAFYFDDVLDTHFVALGILDDGNGAVKLIKLQIMIDGHGFAGLDVVEYETFVKCSNI
jgi:hypothetical protein